MFIFSKLHTTSNNTWTSKRQNQWWSHQRRSRPIWKLCPSYVLVFIYSGVDFDLSFMSPEIYYHLCLFQCSFSVFQVRLYIDILEEALTSAFMYFFSSVVVPLCVNYCQFCSDIWSYMLIENYQQSHWDYQLRIDLI